MTAPVLQRVERFVLYSISESQFVTEWDSPAPGLTSQIATKIADYEFFSSSEKAIEYLEGVRRGYTGKNNTLSLITRDGQSFLEGQLDHKYSHSFEIHHAVISREMLAQELPENLEELLSSPRRRIVSDIRHDPHNNTHGFLRDYKEDLSKLTLF